MKEDLYNLALDCVDKHANILQNKHKVALVYLQEDPSGEKLREPPQRLSYSSLQSLTNAMANGFASLGLAPGSRILLRLENSTEFPISFLGAVKAGLIPVPTSPLLTWPELEFMLRDSGAAALLSTQSLYPSELADHELPELRNSILIGDSGFVNSLNASDSGRQAQRWQDLLKTSSAQFETKPTRANDPAFWLYTSGTEGRPKAVIHAHRSIRAHDARARLWQDLQSGDVVFNTSALNWSYALTAGLLDVWRHGLTSVVYRGKPKAETIAAILARHGVTVLMSVPGIYRRLLPLAAENPRLLSGLRIALCAGEKLPTETRNRFLEHSGLEIREGLGMTEHSVYLVQKAGEPTVEGSCGQPLPEQKVDILREDLSPCGTDEVGILASHRDCDGLMLGYHGEASSHTFQNDWFLSGDLASRDAEGNYFFLGRRDEVLNAGGYRISPVEVETALNQDPAVEESAVVGLETQDGKSFLQAFVVLKPKTPATQETAHSLLKNLESSLAQYKIPRQIVFLRELPKTSNGKLQRSRLRPHAHLISNFFPEIHF